MRQLDSAQTEGSAEHSEWSALVQKAVLSIRFGVVQLVVHDGKVVQIEKTEKLRIEQRQ